MSRSTLVAILVCSLAVLVSGTPCCAVYYVDVGAEGANNGTSWQNAFTTIQAAVDAGYASGGGEVWVKAGVYDQLTGAPITDSFEASDPDAVDILGQEMGLYYMSGGTVKTCHITVQWLEGDVTGGVQRLILGSPSESDNLAVRLLTIAQERPDLLIFLNHPSRTSDVVSQEDLATAVNAGALYVMEVVGPGKVPADIAKWDYVLAHLDDQAGDCSKILWGIFSDDEHVIKNADFRTSGAEMGLIPTSAQDPAYSNRRLAYKDMIRRGSLVALPPNSKCSMPTYVLENSTDGLPARMQVNLFVDNIGGASSAYMRFYGCDWSTGSVPGSLLYQASVALNAGNSITYYLTTTGASGGTGLTPQQRANIKYVRPVLTWIVSGKSYRAYLQPVRIRSSGDWWNGPAYTLAGDQGSVGPSPYPSGGADSGETVYFNTHSHTLASDGDAAPFLMRRRYWTTYGGLDPAKPRFDVLTDHGVAVPFETAKQSVVTLKQGVHVYGGFAGTETSGNQRNWTANVTTIDGRYQGRCVYSTNVTDAVIDGFVITNGLAPGSCGGGMLNIESSPTVRNCKFIGNMAGYSGGAIQNFSSSPVIANCIFLNNSVNNSRSTGGAIDCVLASEARITNNTIVENYAPSGGGIYCSDSRAEIANNILAFNSCGVHVKGSPPTLACNGLYMNSENYHGVSGGVGDVLADPLFMNRLERNYRIWPDSRCVNSGSNAATGLPSTDFDGEARIAFGTVDIGADECQSPATAIRATRWFPDGASVSLEGIAVSAAFEDFFYIESAGRESGMRVSEPEHEFTAGMKVSVVGTLRTNSDGERYIDAASVVQTGWGEVKPLYMPNRSIGGTDWNYCPTTGAGQSGVQYGADLNNIGLLISTTGKVVQVGSGYFYLDDGSVAQAAYGPTIKVSAPGLTLPAPGKCVKVTGISSCYRSNYYSSAILVPTQSDIVVLN